MPLSSKQKDPKGPRHPITGGVKKPQKKVTRKDVEEIREAGGWYEYVVANNESHKALETALAYLMKKDTQRTPKEKALRILLEDAATSGAGTLQVTRRRRPVETLFQELAPEQLAGSAPKQQQARYKVTYNARAKVSDLLEKLHEFDEDNFEDNFADIKAEKVFQNKADSENTLRGHEITLLAALNDAKVRKVRKVGKGGYQRLIWNKENTRFTFYLQLQPHEQQEELCTVKKITRAPDDL